jgi:hypothetical protein
MVQQIASRLISGGYELKELSPEASPRRYFRISGKEQLLVTSEQAPAVECQQLLTECGIITPQYLDAVDGGYLVEDIGDEHLAHAPSIDNYQMLIDDWFKFSKITLAASHPNSSLVLDAKLFNRELKQFVDSFLIEHQRLTLADNDLAAINDLCHQLAEDACAGPQCLQHRDFHCRNIMLNASYQRPVWIDFQDMRPGPIFYDLASLHTDAYIDLDDNIFILIAEAAVKLGAKHGMHTEDVHPQFLLTALQRVLKALGTFGSLINGGRDDYRGAASRATICAIALLDQLPDYYDLRKYLG